MGTDIHFFIEKRKTSASKWSRVEITESLLPKDRDYPIFAYLAGVRNGFGFAGCEMFLPIEKPLFAERGIPEDSSLFDGELGQETPWIGDHSFSFATWQEIENIPDVDIYWKGIVDRDNYNLFLKNGKPKSWCGMAHGESVKIAPSEQTFQENINFTHVQINWIEENYYSKNYFNIFFKYVFERLISPWSFNYDKSNIRVLMGFDS